MTEVIKKKKNMFETFSFWNIDKNNINNKKNFFFGNCVVCICYLYDLDRKPANESKILMSFKNFFYISFFQN
jgi:hypothetical protein